MKTVLIFYSYSGNTRQLASKAAEKMKADIVEIKDVKKPKGLKVMFGGCFDSIKGKQWPIEEINVDLTQYDRIMLMGPIWARNFTPQINSVINRLPKNKEVGLIAVSGGSGANFDKAVKKIEGRNCKVVKTKDILMKDVKNKKQ